MSRIVRSISCWRPLLVAGSQRLTIIYSTGLHEAAVYEWFASWLPQRPSAPALILPKVARSSIQGQHLIRCPFICDHWSKHADWLLHRPQPLCCQLIDTSEWRSRPLDKPMVRTAQSWQCMMPIADRPRHSPAGPLPLCPCGLTREGQISLSKSIGVVYYHSIHTRTAWR